MRCAYDDSRARCRNRRRDSRSCRACCSLMAVPSFLAWRCSPSWRFASPLGLLTRKVTPPSLISTPFAYTSVPNRVCDSTELQLHRPSAV